MHWKHVTSERGFDDADSGREGKPATEKPKDQLPSYHLTTTANPLRTQPHSQSESVHNSGVTTHVVERLNPLGVYGTLKKQSKCPLVPVKVYQTWGVSN